MIEACPFDKTEKKTNNCSRSDFLHNNLLVENQRYRNKGVSWKTVGVLHHVRAAAELYSFSPRSLTFHCGY